MKYLDTSPSVRWTKISESPVPLGPKTQLNRKINSTLVGFSKDPTKTQPNAKSHQKM